MTKLKNYIKPKSESKILDYCLDTLEPIHRAAICYKFGIGGTKPMTYKEIGKVMGNHIMWMMFWKCIKRKIEKEVVLFLRVKHHIMP